MSRSLNKVILIGNVGLDPEIRMTASGVKVARISLATNRVFTDRSGQRKEKTEWHRLSCWDRLADVVEQYVKKGDRLYVEGRIEYSQSEDDNGNTRHWTDIVVRELIMLGSPNGEATEGGQRRQAGQTAGTASAPASSPGSTPFDDESDDLPF